MPEIQSDFSLPNSASGLDETIGALIRCRLEGAPQKEALTASPLPPTLKALLIELANGSPGFILEICFSIRDKPTYTHGEIWPKFAVWLLEDFLPPLATKDSRVLKCLATVAQLYRCKQYISQKEWDTAAASAAAAAAYAAYAAAYAAYAASAAAAASARASATYTAAAAAATTSGAASVAAYHTMRQALLHITHSL